MRGRLAEYGNDLLSLGIDGMRLDAAKRNFILASTLTLSLIYCIDMPAGDIANILGRFSRKPYITQEVIFGQGEPIQPSEYVGNGDVQE